MRLDTSKVPVVDETNNKLQTRNDKREVDNEIVKSCENRL